MHGTSARNGRLHVDVVTTSAGLDHIGDDVRAGLLSPQKSVPPKYFYDDYGARLFDAICDLPEYYLTRTEQALLAAVADEIIALAAPADIVEFGSGAARKTRTLLEAVQRTANAARYVPVDVSEEMLLRAAHALLDDFPRLRIHAIVGDYERDLNRLPTGQRRLVLFLGSSIGNFTPAATRHFLSNLRQQLSTGDHLLLGVDLVKATPILEAAYNDSAGLTAAFNRNVLHVINRHLGGDFHADRFEHVAFFNEAQSQIEMHLRAGGAHTVTLRGLNLSVPFRAGETIHTEISRKFTRAEVESALQTAGFVLRRWYTPANHYFGLALASAADAQSAHR